MQPFWLNHGLNFKIQTMKLTIVSLLLTCCAFYSSSQDFNNRLTTVYSVTELDEIAEYHPERVKILNYALDNAFEVLPLPKGKESKLNGELQIQDLDQLSFETLKLKIAESNQYYKISGTDKLLLVKSFFVLENEMTATN